MQWLAVGKKKFEDRDVQIEEGGMNMTRNSIKESVQNITMRSNLV